MLQMRMQISEGAPHASLRFIRHRRAWLMNNRREPGARFPRPSASRLIRWKLAAGRSARDLLERAHDRLFSVVILERIGAKDTAAAAAQIAPSV